MPTTPAIQTLETGAAATPAAVSPGRFAVEPLGERARAILSEVMLASGPRPELAERLALFGQFAGSWDIVVTNHPPDGPAVSINGEWHFGWALEGRAILDVWMCPRRDRRAGRETPGEYGATLRFFDPTIDAWRSTWIGPVRGLVRPFIARQVGEEIVLSGSFAPGVDTRWIFSRITARSFYWRAEESRDGWQTRHLLQEMHATRASETAR